MLVQSTIESNWDKWEILGHLIQLDFPREIENVGVAVAIQPPPTPPPPIS